ncbi:MAG: hypothetical protein J6J65_05555 [Opitutales bacterium]|nr:hypothetical protein [Opitutales bacterium]
MNGRSLSNKKMNERSFTAEPSSSFLRNMRESPQKIQALGMHNRLLSYGGLRRKMAGGKAFCLHTAAKPAFQDAPGRKGRADIAPPLSKSKIFPERHSPPIRPKKFDGLPPPPKPVKREECGIWKLSFSRGNGRFETQSARKLNG